MDESKQGSGISGKQSGLVQEGKKEQGEPMETFGSGKIIGEIEKIVTPRYVLTHIFERIKNSLDTFPYEAEREKLPWAVVMPGTKEEVSEILKVANAQKAPIFIRGSGTSFTGASRYHVPGIVLSTHRLDSIEVSEDYGFFECGPGCIIASLEEALKPRGFFLPAAPGSRLIASMGGIIANNTSAHIVDTSMGKPGDYVLGLEVVLPTGEVIETGTKGLRRPAGTDLTKLFVGGDGLLGVVTKIRMRLVPQFERACGLAVYESLEAVARAVQRVYTERRPAPLFMEFMDEKSAQIGYEL
jgi:glycolate oxidase